MHRVLSNSDDCWLRLRAYGTVGLRNLYVACTQVCCRHHLGGENFKQSMCCAVLSNSMDSNEGVSLNTSLIHEFAPASSVNSYRKKLKPEQHRKDGTWTPDPAQTEQHTCEGPQAKPDLPGNLGPALCKITFIPLFLGRGVQPSSHTVLYIPVAQPLRNLPNPKPKIPRPLYPKSIGPNP